MAAGSSSTRSPRLTPPETELREHLLRAAAACERVLPAARMSLEEWIQRRMPGELILRVDDGAVVLAKPGSDTASTKKNGKEPGSLPTPPPPPGGKSGASGKGKSTAAESAISVEAFLNGLPEDSFTPAEDKLREALLLALANGPMPRAKVAAHKEVLPCLRAFLPRSVPIHKWIELRIGAEVAVFDDEQGQQMMRRVGDESEQEVAAPVEEQDPEQAREQQRSEFFASLPDDSFMPAEEALRMAIFDFLATWRSKELATLEVAERNKDVRSARDAFIPSVVSVSEWIEARIGGEVELKTNEKATNAIHLLPDARKIVTERYKELQQQAPEAPAAKAKNKPAEAETWRKPVVMSQAEKQAFFQKLPTDELKPEELRLREVLLDLVSNARSRPLVLSEVLGMQTVKSAHAWMPAGLPMEEWIEERIGGEIDVKKDDRVQGKFVLVARQSEAVEEPAPAAAPASAAAGKKGSGKRAEKPATEVSPAELERRKEAFFNKLPSDSFAPAEERLREALLTYLDKYSGHGPPILKEANQDPAISEAGRMLLPKGSVTLQDWIEKRIGGEVETRETDRGSDIWFALVGELDGMLSADAKGAGKKRKAESLGNSAGSAKGKSKRR